MSNQYSVSPKVTFGVIILLFFFTFISGVITKNIILPNYGKKSIAKIIDSSQDDYVYFKFCDENFKTYYGNVARDTFSYKQKSSKYYAIIYWRLNPDVNKIHLDKEIVDTSIISEVERTCWKFR